MNTLVAKEVRQLRPAFVAALLLAAVPAWLYPTEWNSFYQVEAVWGLGMPLFCIGLLLLALTCFGREFGMGTFPVLLALPVTRQRIWWTKIAVLLCAMAIVLAVGAVSAGLWFNARSGHLSWPLAADDHFVQPIVAVIQQLAAVILAFVVIFASGLWTTLFLRQTLAAFWFAMVVPLALLMLASWGGENILVGEVVLGIYAVAGFFLAQRLFYRAQEVAWTGGEVNLPELRSASAVRTAAGRNYRPLAAFIGKELQLYKVALAGMAALFVLHLGAILLRRALLRSDPDSHLAAALSEFGGLWLLVPLATAGISVSEERRMGTMEAHLCLPVSQRVQFMVKLVTALLFGGLLCGSLFWLAERIGTVLHAGSSILVSKDSLDLQPWKQVVLLFLIISFVVFFVSTLARNLLQAIAIAVLMGFGILLWPGVNSAMWTGRLEFLNGPLFNLLFLPPLMVVTLWLAYTNFRRLTEARRAWWRIIRLLGATFLIAATATALIFFRTWEYLPPLEPGHGSAKITLASEPRLRFHWNSISVAMPDGWLWAKRIAFEEPKKVNLLGSNQPISLGAGRWVTTPANDAGTGSNWIAQACDYYMRVAIRSDGTLWISKEPVRAFRHQDGHLIANKPAPMVQFGNEADWKDVVWLSGGDSVALLKNDGTLWVWGIEYGKKVHGFSGGPPTRLGTNSGWSHFLETPSGVDVWKEDGSAWTIAKVDRSPQEFVGGLTKFGTTPITEWGNLKLRSYATSERSRLAVREDGTLWFHFSMPATDDRQLVQVGTETNWVSVAGDYRCFVGLKNDGTLWKWNTGYMRSYSDDITPQMMSESAYRLGTHDDWVALDRAGPGICSLAADGSVWLWTHEFEQYIWLAPSRKPIELGNVFEQ